MKGNFWRRGVVITFGCLVGILVVGVGLAAAAKPPGTPGGNGKQNGKKNAGTNVTHTSNGVHGGQVLWAAPSGSGAACTAHAPCSLDYAVSHAPDGATVRAKSGIYTGGSGGGITISTALHLVGQGHAVLDASKPLQSGAAVPQVAGITITASRASVSHFTVENAYFEGILVEHADWVTIDHDIIVNNNTGFQAQSFGECQFHDPIPGDCGEGIHLLSSTHSVVAHNRISGNAGGILLTDEAGPTAYNVIQHNVVRDNPYDCGITLASHSTYGVSNNLVQFNVTDRNGVLGEGAGILMAGAFRGTVVSDNTITHNEASGNGLAGVTLHQHASGNLNGNTITYNRLSNNNIRSGGDPDAGVTDSTDILVLGAAGPLSDTTIENNQLSNAHYGIWTRNVPVPPNSVAQNHFGPNVDVPIQSS
jgi:parallel beta-helix repeat protein